MGYACRTRVSLPNQQKDKEHTCIVMVTTDPYPC